MGEEERGEGGKETVKINYFSAADSAYNSKFQGQKPPSQTENPAEYQLAFSRNTF